MLVFTNLVLISSLLLLGVVMLRSGSPHVLGKTMT